MRTPIGYRSPAVRRRCATVLVLALVGTLATGCTEPSPATHAAASRTAPAGATAPIDPAAWALADRLTGRDYTADTTAAMVAALARSGISTFADPSAAGPEQPVTGPANALRLLDFQAHALAVGAWAGAGFTGAELDAIVPLPPGQTGMPTTSELLAGYVAAARSPGGDLSRALMAGQNLLAPPALRFPAVVLVLFAADLAAPAAARPSDTAGTSGSLVPAVGRAPGAVGPGRVGVDLTPAGLVRRAAGGICSSAAEWVDNTIVGFFSALRLATPDNLPGAILVSIWNWLVGEAEALVHTLIKELTDAVLGTIRQIAWFVSDAAEQIVSMLPYAVKVVTTGDGGGSTFPLGQAPLAGTFTATVSAGDLPDWPPILADCAHVASVRLPDFHAKGLPLTWGAVQAGGDLPLYGTTPAPTDGVTDAAGQATWTFHTGTDPGDPNGEQRNQRDAIPVAVHRPEIEAARDRLTYALLGAIPDLLRPYVARLFAPYLDGLRTRLNALLDARGTGSAFLIFHAGPTPKPSAPTTAATGACGVTPATYAGTDTITSRETITLTGGSVVDHSEATGPLTLTVAPGGGLSGTWGFRKQDDFDENIEVAGVKFRHHAVRTFEMTGGVVTGNSCDLGLTSGSVRQLSCVGDCRAPSRPTPTAVLPSFGAPVVRGGGLTWVAHIEAADGLYSATLTVTVARSG